MTQSLVAGNGSLFNDVVAETSGIGANLNACIQCGTCGGSCPSAPDMDHSPRKIFADVHKRLKLPLSCML